MNFRALCWTILTLAALALCSGCRRDADGKANPYYLRGLTLRQNDQFTEAAEAFNKCLRINPDAARAHLQLGGLYEDHLDSPIAAMYHYLRYLQIQPDGQNADVVRESMERLERDLVADGLAKHPELLEAMGHDEELVAEIEQLQQIRASLIAQIRKQSQIIRELRAKRNEAKP